MKKVLIIFFGVCSFSCSTSFSPEKSNCRDGKIDMPFIEEMIRCKIDFEESVCTNAPTIVQDSLRSVYVNMWICFEANRENSISSISKFNTDNSNRYFSVCYFDPKDSKIPNCGMLTCTEFQGFLMRLLEVRNDSILLKNYSPC
jgi:hypothetical protein